MASDLVNDLAGLGMSVEVVTQMPTRNVDDQTRLAFKGKKREVRGSIVINRVAAHFDEQGFLLKRLIHSLLVSAGIFLRALFIKGDVIFAYSTPPTMGLTGVILSKVKRIPLLYNLQDIFPDSMLNSGVLKGGPILKLGRWLENITYKGSNRIAVICEDFKRIIMSRGVPERKIAVVYNWIDEQQVVPVCRTDNVLISRYNLAADKFYVTYCGNIGLTQNLELLVDAVHSLREECPDLHCVIIGEGAHKPSLENYISGRNAGNISVFPFQPYEDIAHVYSLCDIGVVISKQGISKNSFPSKTWSIISASRAVLASFDEDSELCQKINSIGCGICVPPEDFNSLRIALVNAYNKRGMLAEMGAKGRKFINDHLARRAGTAQFYRLISELTPITKSEAPEATGSDVLPEVINIEKNL